MIYFSGILIKLARNRREYLGKELSVTFLFLLTVEICSFPSMDMTLVNGRP